MLRLLKRLALGLLAIIVLALLGAYVAKPKGDAQGGVVVIQEIFGVNHHVRAVVDGYAAAG